MQKNKRIAGVAFRMSATTTANPQDQKMDSMKTIENWLREGLSPDNFQKAMKAIQQQGSVDNIRICVSDFIIALSHAFIWSESDEGFEYWNKLSESC